MGSYKKIVTRTAPVVVPLLILGLRYWLSRKRHAVDLIENEEDSLRTEGIYDLIDNILSSIPIGRIFRS